MNKLKKPTKRVSAVLLAGALLVPGSIFAEEQVKNDYSTHWARVTIQKWVDEGLIKGVKGKGVLPNNSVTRAEFVRMANMRYAYSTPAEANKFTDVKAKDWFYQDILIAQKENYIAGITDKLFGPNQTVTREQAATIVARLAKIQDEASGVNKFKDANKISEYAKGSIGGAAKEGFVSGYEDGTFRPKNPLTRAEAMILLEKAHARQDTTDEKTEFIVTFDSRGGTAVKSQVVKKGQKVIKPADPTKEGERFLGWYLDNKKFDFDVVIGKDITLVAKWEIQGEFYSSGSSSSSYSPSKEEILKEMAKKTLERKSGNSKFGVQRFADGNLVANALTINLDESVAKNVNDNLNKIAGPTDKVQQKLNSTVSKSNKIFYKDGAEYKPYLTKQRMDNKILPVLNKLGFGDLTSKLTFDSNGMLVNLDATLVDSLLKSFTDPENAQKVAAMDVEELKMLVRSLEEPMHSPDATSTGMMYPIMYKFTLTVNEDVYRVVRGDLEARDRLVAELHRLSNLMTRNTKEVLGEIFDVSVKFEAKSEYHLPGNPNEYLPKERRVVVGPSVENFKLPLVSSVDEARAAGILGVHTDEDVNVLKAVRVKLVELGIEDSALTNGNAILDLAKLHVNKDKFTREELELLLNIIPR